MLSCLAKRVCVVTGGASGIGAETVRLLASNGAKVTVADIESARPRAESLISSIQISQQQNINSKYQIPLFKSVDILDWSRMVRVFHETEQELGPIQHVIANAGVMESRPTMDLDDICDKGELKPPTEAYRVIDVNLKGALNTLKIALYHMRGHTYHHRSIVLLGSTSSYFGESGVTAYVASKHGVLGLLRSSQGIADEIGVRVNAVAPFYTPTNMTSAYCDDWAQADMKRNTPSDIAVAIVDSLLHENQRGCCNMVVAGTSREVEQPRIELLEGWIGADVVQELEEAKRFFKKLGGYPLPSASVVP